MIYLNKLFMNFIFSFDILFYNKINIVNFNDLVIMDSNSKDKPSISDNFTCLIAIIFLYLIFNIIFYSLYFIGTTAGNNSFKEASSTNITNNNIFCNLYRFKT